MGVEAIVAIVTSVQSHGIQVEGLGAHGTGRTYASDTPHPHTNDTPVTTTTTVDGDVVVPTPPFVPWVRVAHQTLALGHPIDGTSTVPYLGTVPTEQACQDSCTLQSNCTEYVWNNATSMDWRHRCYGRHDSVWALSPSTDSYSGRRVNPGPRPPPPPPPPLPPPPPAPVPPGVVTLRVLEGRPVDPYFFGWNLESWGQDINLTYSDTAGLAYAAALHTGVLRYPGSCMEQSFSEVKAFHTPHAQFAAQRHCLPLSLRSTPPALDRRPFLIIRRPGGTGSNIWDPRAGHFLPDRIPAGTPPGAYAKYLGFVPFINDLPRGTLSAANFVQGLGGTARRVVWDLNVFVFNATEACDQIQYVGTVVGTGTGTYA
jgi:hypothetical protein